jgi:glucose uptake protein GlcU
MCFLFSRWYERKTFSITAIIAVIIIILVIVLGAVLGTRNKNEQATTMTTTILEQSLISKHTRIRFTVSERNFLAKTLSKLIVRQKSFYRDKINAIILHFLRE